MKISTSSQEPLWIAHMELASSPGHPFYEKLNELLDAERFDPFVEGLSTKFYANKRRFYDSAALRSE